MGPSSQEAEARIPENQPDPSEKFGSTRSRRMPGTGYETRRRRKTVLSSGMYVGQAVSQREHAMPISRNVTMEELKTFRDSVLLDGGNRQRPPATHSSKSCRPYQGAGSDGGGFSHGISISN